MAIEIPIPDIHLRAFHRLTPLPAEIAIVRHGEKTDSSGPLTPGGWMSAHNIGIHIGKIAADTDVYQVLVESGQVPRTIQTAEAVASGAEVAYIQRRGQVPTSPVIQIGKPRPELSLSAIADGTESVFVQKYITTVNAIQNALSACPRFIIPFLRAGKLEQEAAGKLLLEWLALDNKRMTLPNGQPDPHTRSAREIAQMQAFVLKQDIARIKQNYMEGKPVKILKYSHENMVLIWARYFLYREVAPGRRNKSSQIIRGMEIVNKIGGKIPYLGGVHIHFFQQNDGDIKLRARFNNAWYEVDTEMIDALAEEVYMSDKYVTNPGLLAQAKHESAANRANVRREIYIQRDLAVA